MSEDYWEKVNPVLIKPKKDKNLWTISVDENIPLYCMCPECSKKFKANFPNAYESFGHLLFISEVEQ